MADKKRFTSSRKLDHLRSVRKRRLKAAMPGFQISGSCIMPCRNATWGKSTYKPVPGPYLLLSSLHIGDDRGSSRYKDTNARLARAAERYGIGMGVGSQRAALENPSLVDTFSVVRDEAPHAFLVANLGVVQLRDHGIEWAEQGC